VTNRRKTFSDVLSILIVLAFLFLSFASLFFVFMDGFLLEFLFNLQLDLHHFFNHELQVLFASIAY
jgi:hypothetical protein